jgi:hypothetical protein
MSPVSLAFPVKANCDTCLDSLWLHLGHRGVLVVFTLREKKLKIVLQSWQKNSYIGIFHTHPVARKIKTVIFSIK